MLRDIQYLELAAFISGMAVLSVASGPPVISSFDVRALSDEFLSDFNVHKCPYLCPPAVMIVAAKVVNTASMEILIISAASGY